MFCRKAGLLAVSVSFLISSPLLAEPIKTEAVITNVQGNTITAKTMSGPLTVILTPSTSIAQTSGLAKKKTRDARALIPGLIFTVDGDIQGQTVTAEHIRFKEKDWRTAVATKAGTVEQFSELRKAIIEGQEYVIRDEAAVYFPSGSAVIGADLQAEAAHAGRKSAILRQLQGLDPGLCRSARQRSGQYAAEREARQGGQHLPAPDGLHPAGPGPLAVGNGRRHDRAGRGCPDRQRCGSARGGSDRDPEDAADAVARLRRGRKEAADHVPGEARGALRHGVEAAPAALHFAEHVLAAADDRA